MPLSRTLDALVHRPLCVEDDVHAHCVVWQRDRSPVVRRGRRPCPLCGLAGNVIVRPLCMVRVSAHPMSAPATRGVCLRRFVRGTTSTSTARWTSTRVRPRLPCFTHTFAARRRAASGSGLFATTSTSPRPTNPTVFASTRRGGVSHTTAQRPFVFLRRSSCVRAPSPERSSRHVAALFGGARFSLTALCLSSMSSPSQAPASQSRSFDIHFFQEASSPSTRATRALVASS